jgi:hypothetical protein
MEHQSTKRTKITAFSTTQHKELVSCEVNMTQLGAYINSLIQVVN